MDLIELSDIITTEEHAKLPKELQAAYKEENGKLILNRKGRDTLKLTLDKERERAEKAENEYKSIIKELGMPVEKVKEMLAELENARKDKLTEAERIAEAMKNAELKGEERQKALEEQLAAIKGDLDKSKVEATRLKVQAACKIPETLMKFLIGDNFETLMDSGKELMSHMKPEFNPSEGRVGNGPPAGGVDSLTADDIAGQIKAGLEAAKTLSGGAGQGGLKSAY